MAANPYTNFVVISTDFSASGALGAATVDSSGALPPLPLIKLPLTRAGLFDAAGIGYSFSYDASFASTGFAANLAVSPSAVVQSHLTTRVGGAFNTWTNGAAAGNMLDLSFNFKSRWTRLRFDTLNASGLLGANSLGQHVALIATNALLQYKPSRTDEALVASRVNTIASSINTQVATRLGAVLGSQAVQDAILKALVAANGPVLDPSGNRLPYDAAFSGLDLVLYLYNLSCDVTFPGQTAKTLKFDRLPLQISIS
jgi:hypothetical protein